MGISPGQGAFVPNHDIIAIGGSTGSLDVLRRVFADLPADLPACLFVVRHIATEGTDLLAAILDEAGPLDVRMATDGAPIIPGMAYVAPPGRHLMLESGAVRLGRGPRENMARPAVDPLFRSAALNYGSRVIGVVLTGLLDDGAAGLAAVKRSGGIAIVQDPADSEADDMPRHALTSCDVDYRFPVAKMGQGLARIALEPAPPSVPASRDLALEVEIAAGRPSTTDVIERIATPVALSCPACSGVLSEIGDHSRLRFRCQIGHAYSADTLDKAHESAVIEALGVALRIIEERHTLMRKMAADAERHGRGLSSRMFNERAAEYRRQADIIRKAALDGIE